jgi:hypothetical protein
VDGDCEAAEAIRDFVADRYDHHPVPDFGQAPVPIGRKRRRAEGRER